MSQPSATFSWGPGGKSHAAHSTAKLPKRRGSPLRPRLSLSAGLPNRCPPAAKSVIVIVPRETHEHQDLISTPLSTNQQAVTDGGREGSSIHFLNSWVCSWICLPQQGLGGIRVQPPLHPPHPIWSICRTSLCRKEAMDGELLKADSAEASGEGQILPGSPPGLEFSWPSHLPEPASISSKAFLLPPPK